MSNTANEGAAAGAAGRAATELGERSGGSYPLDMRGISEEAEAEEGGCLAYTPRGRGGTGG